MTDGELIHAALSAVASTPSRCVLLRRNGRILLALPPQRSAAIRTLGLYRPQRPKARVAAILTRFAVGVGMHRILMPGTHHPGGATTVAPGHPGCIPGTAGVMLGSPEHRVRRAIVVYDTAGGPEVAKLAFGDGGRAVIQGEHDVLSHLDPAVPGAPLPNGVHHGAGLSLLCLPYQTGRPFGRDAAPRALALLDAWLHGAPPAAAPDFPEWSGIEAGLRAAGDPDSILTAIAAQRLVPAIRHGDFARWNLLIRNDGSVVALDWEWGHPRGMPGLDLAHFVLQDLRLVDRMDHEAALRQAAIRLSRPNFREHLVRAGWHGDALLPVVASLAWKQGEGHQDNLDILRAATLAVKRHGVPA